MTISTSYIIRRKGNTDPVRVCVKDQVADPADIANATFTLTVASEPYPTDGSSELFQVNGSIIGLAADGIVDFPITGGNEDEVGFYYFEVEMIDSGGIKDTIVFGWYHVKQDITKS